MAHPMSPRKESGDGFFDEAFVSCYQRIGYPKQWIQEGKQYTPEQSYVISHPAWFWEELPAIPSTSIYGLFKETVKRCSDEVAVIFFDRSITYRDLDVLIRKYATLLKELGIGKGDVVATLLPNSLQHIVAFYGATMIGAVHTPVNVMYQAEEVTYQIEDAGAENVFILDLFYDKVKGLHDNGTLKNVITTNIRDFAALEPIVSDAVRPMWDIPKPSIPGCLDFFDSLEKLAPQDTTADCDPEHDTALLLYTAGTTGRSKGVIETHANPGLHQNNGQGSQGL